MIYKRHKQARCNCKASFLASLKTVSLSCLYSNLATHRYEMTKCTILIYLDMQGYLRNLEANWSRYYYWTPRWPLGVLVSSSTPDGITPRRQVRQGILGSANSPLEAFKFRALKESETKRESEKFSAHIWMRDLLAARCLFALPPRTLPESEHFGGTPHSCRRIIHQRLGVSTV